MTRRIPLAIAAAVIWSAVSPVAQSPPAAIGEPTTLCGRVAGPDGLAVRGLTAPDFTVYEDGARREVLEITFAPPLALVLLIDVSASMAYHAAIAEIVGDAGRALRPDDRVGVGTFGQQIEIGPIAAPDPAAMLDAGRAIVPRRKDNAGPSPLWDGVNAAVSALDRHERRRALIVFTDGEVTGNLTRYEVVERHALASRVQVFMVLQGASHNRPASRPDAGLRFPWERPAQIARATGGETLADIELLGAWRPDLFRTALLRAIDDVTQQYCLTFRPTVPDGRFHDLDVRLRRAGVVTRWPEVFLAAPRSTVALSGG
jgi:hypothetical protein